MEKESSAAALLALGQEVGLAGFESRTTKRDFDFSKADISTSDGIKALARALGLAGVDPIVDARS